MKIKKLLFVTMIYIMFSCNGLISQANGNGYWKIKDSSNNFNENAWIYEKEDGSYAKGWIQIDNKWYYFNTEGTLLTNIWIEDYYLGEDGSMATNTWIIDKIGTSPNLTAYYVGTDGKWIKNMIYHGCEGNWMKDSIGWCFQKEDGTYSQEEYEYINDHWYMFDDKGYMKTGLVINQETGKLNYFYSDGSLAIDAGWIPISRNEWIYVEGTSCIVDNITPDGYFINSDGIWK